jgi:uncharacterized protein (UPF0332 family)
MSLKEWLKNGWLADHKTSPQEITNIFKAADRDLATAKAAGLDSDWKLNIAYSAALHLANAALAAKGYRAARDSHHYRTIQSLAYSIKADPKLITQLDRFRKKRNLGTYEIAGAVSDQEAKEMIMLAVNLRKQVKEWLRKNHPGLLSGKS